VPAQGRAGSLTADSVLQSGQTEAGDYIAAASNGQAGTVLVQFWPHLPESLQEGHINVIPEGGGPTTEYLGSGQAAASYMCVYQSFNEGMTFESFISTMPGSIYAGPLSGVMTWRSNQSNGLLRGTWPTPRRSRGHRARRHRGRTLPETAIPLTEHKSNQVARTSAEIDFACPSRCCCIRFRR
jgi:hypothetical protein